MRFVSRLAKSANADHRATRLRDETQNTYYPDLRDPINTAVSQLDNEERFKLKRAIFDWQFARVTVA